VTVSDADYAILAERFGVDVDNKRQIKEALHEALINFAKKQKANHNSAD
jgi:transposase